jgi:hypothetical protein
MIQASDFRPVGEWSNRRCPDSMIGHNINVTRIVWSGTLNGRSTGTQTCLACGATRSVMSVR